MSGQKVFNRYAVVVGSCMIGLLSGLVYSWSIFVQPIIDEYRWGTDQVAMMGNVMIALFSLGSAVGGFMLPKLGARTTSLIGALMFGLGILVSAFVASPALMYVTWGVVAGLGVGILYNVGMFVTSAWFPDKRGLIMGIFLALFGLSLTVFSAPISWMLESMGVKTAILVLGIILTVVLTVVALFLMRMPPEGWVPEGYVPPVRNSDGEGVSLTPGEAVRTIPFWLYTIAFFFLVIPYAFISSYTTIFVTEEKGLAAAQAVAIVSVMGVGAFAGRLLGGIIVDKLHCKITYAIFCLSSVLAGILLIAGNNFAAIAAAFFFVSFGYGGRTPVYGIYPVEQFGPKNASAIYGLAVMSTIISSLISPVITAATRASTGSFNTSVIVSIVVALAGMAAILITPRHTPYMRKNG